MRATSKFTYTRLRPVTIALQALSLMGKVELVQVHFTVCLRDQWSKWMQDACKVYMNSYMASNGSCVMVTWTIIKNHLLEVGVTQNQETMALRNLITVDFVYIIICEDLAWIELYRNSIWLRTRLHMTSHYTWNPWPHCRNLEVSWDGLWTLLLGSHNFMVMARVWSGPGSSACTDPLAHEWQ